MDPIYLDYNATTPVRPEVVRAMTACLSGPPGNPSSQHRFGREARAARERARSQVARAAGCRPSEVLFTSGGTEADNLAIRGVLEASPERRHVITASTEHEAILHTLGALSPTRAETTILPVDEDGRIRPSDLESALRPDTALVTLMGANNETGVLADLATLGAICRQRQVLFHVDAVQMFGKVPFSFSGLPLDLASISSHKIGGPKGVGALLVRDGVSLPAQQTGGGQERGIRPGTENLPGIVGFGEAAELAAGEVASEAPRLAALRDRLEQGILQAFPAAQVNGDRGNRLPNTCNVSFPGLDGESLLIALDLEGVAVSTGAACQAGAAEPSHVLMGMGRSAAQAGSSLRFSLGTPSRDSDIVGVLEILPRILSRLSATGSAPSGQGHL
ncbi:MAG: cysteine desulfurase NifS [Gemmatimonadota bacterium]|nr:MAG: cysteine desulfurase NifS [Gemmatimonadota bacterium]